VFVSGFTLAGALAIGSGANLDEFDVFDVLASLVDQSLVLTEPNGDALRYHMLESTQAYTREKLAEAGEYSVCVTRHLYYLRDLFAAAMTRAKQTGNAKEIESLLVAELDDVRSALDGVGAKAELVTCAELLGAIDSRWQWVGLGNEGSARLKRFIALMPADEQRLTSRLWVALARIARDTKPVEALTAASTAVRLARTASDAEALAEALVALANELARAHDFDDATTAIGEAAALAPVHNTWLRLRILNARAFLGYFTGDLAAAALAYEQLRKTYLQLGNTSGANSAAQSLAEVEYQCGQTEKAIATLALQLPSIRAGRDRLSLLSALGNMCGYLVAADRVSEALAIAQEAFLKSSEPDRDLMPMTCLVEHAALAIALQGDARRGATLAGYTEVAFGHVGYRREYTEQITRKRLEALLCESLAPTELESLVAQGAALSSADALALTLPNPEE
jgi:tetratricopeptide (TPR) repeat protein